MFQKGDLVEAMEPFRSSLIFDPYQHWCGAIIEKGDRGRVTMFNPDGSLGVYFEKAGTVEVDEYVIIRKVSILQQLAEIE